MTDRERARDWLTAQAVRDGYDGPASGYSDEEEIGILVDLLAAVRAEGEAAGAEKMRGAALDMYRLAALLCDDDWYYGEQRNALARLIFSFDALGFRGNDEETSWLLDIIGGGRADLLAMKEPTP